jgi:DNA polymerase III epsilon subunit-like protein
MGDASLPSTLCFIDTETTGLDPRIHQAYEVCYWHEDASEPRSFLLPHTLDHADGTALRIGGYFDRQMQPFDDPESFVRNDLIRVLRGATLVGSNPAFDAAMLTRLIGAPVWHHRMIDVSNVAMVVLNEERPLGLAACADACRERGFDIPEPEHTAESDVRATRAVFEALAAIRRAEVAR